MTQFASFDQDQARQPGLSPFHLQINASTPLMSKARFAELVGFKPAVINGWATKGHIPTVMVGRHQLINVAAIQRDCLEREA